MMARRSDRLRSRDPEIVEMMFECFLCKLEGFTCQTNVIRLSCCSNFCHKKCQEVWKKTWSHCGCCRAEIENGEGTGASQSESREAVENVEENSPSHLEPEEVGEPEENPNEVDVIRSLLNDEQCLEEIMSYTPQGYSETMLEYFRFGNISNFKQKMALLCAHLLHGFDVKKIYLLVRFDNPRRLRLYFDSLKQLLLPFCNEFRTMLSVADRGAFDGQIIFSLSDRGSKCASYELTVGEVEFKNSIPEWPTMMFVPYGMFSL